MISLHRPKFVLLMVNRGLYRVVVDEHLLIWLAVAAQQFYLRSKYSVSCLDLCLSFPPLPDVNLALLENTAYLHLVSSQSHLLKIERSSETFAGFLHAARMRHFDEVCRKRYCWLDGSGWRSRKEMGEFLGTSLERILTW